jgi:serine/threonine protein kinase
LVWPTTAAFADFAMTHKDCPSNDELAAFAVGKILDERELMRIDAHLETCAGCVSTLESLSGDGDELISALHTRPQKGIHEGEAECHGALARVLSISQGETQGTDRADSTSDLAGQDKLAAHLADKPETPLGELGQYKLLEQIGAGGMGVVYRALHLKLKRQVALKILHADRVNTAEAVRRFEREIEAGGRLSHPNIVTASDAGEADGRHFLVMELLDGVDLSTLCKRCGSLNVADACELIRQAALGLQCAHQQDMVHRDIKPSNLMLAVSDSPSHQSSSPVVKLLDLGLARIPQEQTTEHATSTDQVMGTIEYMAPEQCLDSRAADVRSDIYSLGATLFKLLCGRSPLSNEEDDTAGKKLRTLLTEQPPSIRQFRSDLPGRLAQLVDRTLARSPDERPATPAEVAERLEPFARGHDLSRLLRRAKSADAADEDTIAEANKTIARPAGSSPIARPPKRMRWMLVALLPLALLLAGGVFWLKTDGGYIRVEADPGIDVTVAVLIDGKPAGSIEVSKSQDAVWYRSGFYEIRLPASAEDKLQIAGNKFTLSPRGGERTVTIRRVTSAERKRLTEARIDAGKDTTVEPDPDVTRLPPARSVTGGYVLKFQRTESLEEVGIRVPNLSCRLLLNKSFTMETWLKRDMNKSTHLVLKLGPHTIMPSAGTTYKMDFRWYGGYLDTQKRSLEQWKQWIHLVGVRDVERGEYRFYANGKMCGRKPIDPLNEKVANPEDVLWIAYRCDIEIGETRISSIARYLDDFVPARHTPDDHTVALYRFNEGQGDVAKDVSGNGYDATMVGHAWVQADGPSFGP